MNRLFIGLLILVLLVSAGSCARRGIPSPYPYYSSLKNRPVNLEGDQPSPYSVLWYNQTLDHFNFQRPGTFQQRILVSDVYWSQPDPETCTTPLIFFCGNEGGITFFYENSLFVTNTLAQEFSALVIFAEHRYYGETLPFGNDSYANENLQYLTVEQALEDYAQIIKYYLNEYNASHYPVFVTSGSYGAMLSAWMRIKYPHIVDGALASSGVFLDFLGTGLPWDFYTSSVTKDFAETSSEGTCASKVRTAFQDLITIASEESGYETLTSAFRLCTPLTNENNFDDFLWWIEAAYNYIAMADYPYPAAFLEPMPGSPVNYTCNLIQAAEGSFDTILTGLDTYFNWTGEAGNCYNTSVFLSQNDIMVPWEYQTCTEIVLALISTGTTDFYYNDPLNITQYIQSCQEQFGITPDPYWVTRYLSGKSDLVPGSNIIFSNGLLDPWHRGGINVTQSDHNIISIVIPGAAHHLDLRAPNVLDPPSVTQARELEIKYLTQWNAEASQLKSKLRKRKNELKI